MADFNHQLIDQQSKDTVNTAATRPVYAIIGSGFAACVNHSTLRWSDWGKARLDRADVVHIHENNPWTGYIDHKMGQWPDLLTLPGFRATPDARLTDYLGSKEFARVVDSEFSDLLGRKNVRQVNGHVEKIERKKIGKKTKKDIYVIHVKGVKDPINADYVDVCTGPGAARLLPRTTSKAVADNFETRDLLVDDAVMKEYSNSDPPGSSKKRRRMMSAHVYMDSQLQKGADVVCVYGSGPLSASCVEQALASGCKAVYWLSKTPLNGSFTPGLRYDPLARLDTGAPLPRRLDPPPDNLLLIPGDKKTKFGEGYKLAEVRSALSRLRLRFVLGRPTDRRPGPRYIDPEKPGAAPLKEIYVDQLIISASNQNMENEPGSSAFLVKDVRAANGGSFSAIKPPRAVAKVPGLGGVTTGLQTADGKFRVLGTAGLRHRDRETADSRTEQPARLVLYEQSLPAQARVALVGVTMCAATISQSNGFFQKNPSDCVNIAHAGELWSVWGVENGLAIYNARRLRIDPFTKDAPSLDDRDHPLPEIKPNYFRYQAPKEYWK